MYIYIYTYFTTITFFKELKWQYSKNYFSETIAKVTYNIPALKKLKTAKPLTHRHFLGFHLVH